MCTQSIYNLHVLVQVHFCQANSCAIIPHACICKRRSPSVSSRMSASAREDLPAYHSACLHLQKKISQRIIPRSASARENLPAYHPACLHLQERISQRIIPHVCICKRRPLSVSSRMPASAKEDLPAYHPACLHLQDKISQRIIPRVCICKRTSASVSSRMSASAREDRPAYHPACLHLQENHVLTRTQSNTTLIHHPTPQTPLSPPLQNTAGSGKKRTNTRNQLGGVLLREIRAFSKDRSHQKSAKSIY